MRTKHRMRTITIVLSLLILVAGCNKNPYPGFEKTENGVYIKYHHKGGGSESPGVDDLVTIDLIYRTPDTVLFESNKQPEELTIPLTKPIFEGDLFSALSILHVGDSVTIVFPADSFFLVMAELPEMPDFVKAGTPMYFDIKLKRFEDQKLVRDELFKKFKEEEPLLISQYLAESKIKTEPLTSGLYYIEKVKGKGSKAKPGEMMKMFIRMSLIDGRTLYSNFDAAPLDIEFGKEIDTKGFEEALAYLSKGTEAVLIVPSHLAYDSLGAGDAIPPYTPLLYEVKLVDIVSKAQYEKERKQNLENEKEALRQAMELENQNLQSYLKKEKITVNPTESGLYYIEKVKGSGKSPVAGNKVKVNYTLYNLKGEKLQSSFDMDQPFTFVLGQSQVIQGWEEGLLLMKEGGKGRFIIPSKLGYGESARSADLPAFSTLVFDIELLEVMPN